jgi:serine/threonine-protein kinase
VWLAEVAQLASNRTDMEDTIAEGQVIAGRFRVGRELGRGGTATVWFATHVKLGAPLALKVMLSQFKADPHATARFLREARAMARLSSDHVARVLDVDVTDDGRPYIAMEYVEGSNLAEILRTRRRLPYSEAATYICQTAFALSEAHALGIIHRDLKPGNLLVTTRRDGSALVKVLDFGISKVPLTDSEHQLTLQEVSIGTPSFMSPEQLRGSRDVGTASDIWALGVILYQLTTGRLPFRADDMPSLCLAILDQPIPRVQDDFPEAPAALDTIIARCLRRAPSERFESVDALRKALLPLARGEAIASAVTADFPSVPEASTTEVGDGAPPRSSTRSHARAWRWTMMGTVGLGVFIAAWFGFGRTDYRRAKLEVLEPRFATHTSAAKPALSIALEEELDHFVPEALPDTSRGATTASSSRRPSTSPAVVLRSTSLRLGAAPAAASSERAPRRGLPEQRSPRAEPSPPSVNTLGGRL